MEIKHLSSQLAMGCADAFSPRTPLGLGFVPGAQATGAQAELPGLTLNDKRCLLNVRLPAAVGMPLRVAYAVPKLRSLATHIASCHGSLPF
jgi:hypothetical protein